MSSEENVFMFSGQGSQYFQMGLPLYERCPVFRHWIERMDAVARDLSGYSVVDVLYGREHARSEEFDQFLITHPAIFMVEYAMAQALIEEGVRPDVALGASLGMFAAASVAGCMTPEDALAAVIGQAGLIARHCEKGGMIAIFASPELFEQAGLRRYCEVAAVNFAEHFVVATNAQSLPQLRAVLRERRITYRELTVSYPFHSRWIDGAREPFEASVRSVSLRAGNIPIACCAQSRLLNSLPNSHLWSIVRQPIRFQQTIQFLERHGTYRYIDAGPSGTLAAFTRYALPAAAGARIHTIMSPFGRDVEKLAETAHAARS